MPKPKTFTAWLMTRRQQENAIGDLARDVDSDPDWPSHKGLPGQRAYLGECGAITAAIETLERAWTEYEAYRASAGAP